MDKFDKYLIENSTISEYYKEYDDIECISYYTAHISVNFNNKTYQTFIINMNNDLYSYKEELYKKLKNIIITDLGNQKLQELNF